jgi:hypothetical protein
MQTTTTKAPKVQIVWVRDMEFDVYHDAELVEHIWMENDGRWFCCPTLLAEGRAHDAQYADPPPQQFELFAGLAVRCGRSALSVYSEDWT